MSEATTKPCAIYTRKSSEEGLDQAFNCWLPSVNAAILNKCKSLTYRYLHQSGEGGIRTLGTANRTHDFQSCTFSHSVTSPKGVSPSTA
jgi:hypothetical protein